MRLALSTVFAVAISTGSSSVATELRATTEASNASAASAWNVAFGGAWMSDYNIRGITQSVHRPSVAAFLEPRYTISPILQLYAGIYGAGIDFPNRAAAQIIYYGGIRPMFGKLSVDLGGWHVDFPGGMTFDGRGSAATCTNGAFFFGQCNTIKGTVSFWEAYGKATFDITDTFAAGSNLYYSPSSLNSGAPGTYASATAKLAVPKSLLPNDIGAYVSGEVGRYWFGTTDAFYGVPAFPLGIKLPDYTTWNVGLSITWKVFTFDLRYYATDLSKADCNVQTGDQTATFGGLNAVTPLNPSGLLSSWCSPAIIARLGFDATAADLK